jgi:hypothetical protein
VVIVFANHLGFSHLLDSGLGLVCFRCVHAINIAEGTRKSSVSFTFFQKTFS